MDAATTRLPTALVAGKYRLGTLLGEGGMGAVYSATDAVTGRVVALKLTPPLEGRMAQRFLREARALARVEHPNVVTLYDAGILPDQRGYLAQKLLPGEDLASALERRGKLPLDESLEIACGILGALGAVHRAGIVHRDVKNSNVYLARDPVRGIVPTLLDFGIVRDGDSRATVAGQLVGTPGSMAPEQAAGRAVDARTDVFAAGLLLLECLTGANPLAADSFAESLARACDPAPYLGVHRTLVRALYGVALADALFAMLATDPRDRPRTAAAALGTLLEAAQSTLPAGAVARLRLTTAPFLASPSRWPDEPSRVRPTPLARTLEGWARVRPWLTRAVVVAALAGASAAWLDARARRAPEPVATQRAAALPSKTQAIAPVVTAPAPLVLPAVAPLPAPQYVVPVPRPRVRRATVPVVAPPAVGARGAPILAP